MASGGSDCNILIWDLDIEELDCKKIIVGTLEAHTNPVSCLAFSPDDQFLCSGSEDKTLILWDVQLK
jgi:WD40 repeat protein